MKKHLRRLIPLFFIGILLLTSLISSSPADVEAASTPIKDTITLTVKFPDTVNESNSPSAEPRNPNLIHDMVLNPYNYPERTGWSGIAYSCVRNDYQVRRYVGTFFGIPIYYWENVPVSGWEIVGQPYNTVDSHQPHAPSRVRNEVIEKYGQELYDLAVASGAQFNYDSTSEIPDHFKNTPQNANHGPTGRYVIHSENSIYYGRHCQAGEKQYFYNNFEFYVTSTFDVYWQEPEDKDGSALGRAYWELDRTNPNAASEVTVLNEFEGDFDQHVAVRNIKHKVKLGNRNVEQEGPIEFTINAQQVKGQNMEYSYEYEFTNKEIGWVCTGLIGENHRCTWDSSPDWRAVRKFELNGSIKVDHQQGETESWNTIDNVLAKKWIVGREDTWNPERQSKVFHEEYKRSSGNSVPTSFNLKTQTPLPILQGAIDYSVEVPSGKHKEGSFNPLRREKSFGYYFPADVDDSLKASYRNTSSYGGYSYAFPLQQHVMNDRGTFGDKRNYTMDYTTDIFMISQHTGYIAGAPYANAVKQSMMNNTSLPSVDTYINQARTNVQMGFQNSTGQQFIDTVLYASPSSLNKLQQYYIPVDANSILHPNQIYKNHIVYQNLGLSDAVFEFDQTFSFAHYLFGSAANDTWIVEQVDSRTSMKTLAPSQINKIRISNAQIQELVNAKAVRTDVRMHGFRFSDRNFVDTVKAIVHF